MILGWMIYALIVSGLATGAALAAERALRLYGRPGRWAWAGALAVSVGLPAAAWLLPAGGAAGAGAAGSAGGVLALPILAAGGEAAWAALTAGSRASSWAPGLDALLLGLWGGSAAATLAYALRSAVRLREERRGWSPGTVDGVPVLLSEGRGPAVVGLLRGRVVLPRWIDELGAEVRRAVLLHEREHLRAGDHRLFALAAAGPLLLPWNPFLWWGLRRLRLAMECDCDARVLSRGVAPGTYGRSLLQVGARLSGVAWGVAGFAEPKTFLERRVETMTERRSKWRGPKAIGAAAAAVGLFFLACEAVPPVEPQATIEAVEAADDAEGAPSFIPYDTPPRLQNASEVQEALRTGYPVSLKEQGVGGTVVLWLHVDETGRLDDARVKETSGHAELDEAALSVARTMAFSPAENEGTPTDVWVAQSITFEPEQSAADLLTSLQRPPGERPLVLVDGEVQDEPAGVLERMSSEEIASIEVVKGEAARERFGDRGAHGVIVVRTKAAAETGG